MINSVLFRKMCHSNYKLMIIFMAVLCLYFTVIANMYDPTNLDTLNQLASLKLSPELLKAMGFTITDQSLVGFIASYFYGLLMLAFPMVFYIILANKLVAAQVEKGTMVYLLAAPSTRMDVAVTQVGVLLTGITALVAFISVYGVAFCSVIFPGLLDIKAFLLMNLGVLLTHFAVSAVCFFASCLFNESKNSLLLGAGVPVGFLLIQMLSKSGNEVKNLKYFTLFSLFNPGDIINSVNVFASFSALIIIGLVIYTLAVKVFEKKDLPI